MSVVVLLGGIESGAHVCVGASFAVLLCTLVGVQALVRAVLLVLLVLLVLQNRWMKRFLTSKTAFMSTWVVTSFKIHAEYLRLG